MRTLKSADQSLGLGRCLAETPMVFSAVGLRVGYLVLLIALWFHAPCFMEPLPKTRAITNSWFGLVCCLVLLGFWR